MYTSWANYYKDLESQHAQQSSSKKETEPDA
jgi:hypothetical protein